MATKVIQKCQCKIVRW